MSREKIVDIGEMRLRKKAEHGYYLPKGECQHRRTTLDSNGCIVTCDDCKMQVDAFWVLKSLIEHWDAEVNKLTAARKELLETKKSVENEHIHLIAARKYEALWRRKHYLPGCPHCQRGILPTDEIRSVFKQTEMERRRFVVKK